MDVERLASPLLEAEGLVLIDVEYRRERNGWTLRLIIDKQDGGVTLKDCAAVSTHLGDLLDARSEGLGPYHLEVSSPGLDRPLTKLSHFVHFAGRSVVVTTGSGVDGKMTYHGVLQGVSDDLVRLDTGQGTIGLAYNDIVKARLNG
ncbi:MAG: ribosome maturation factor RimP [Deltaproteobacteria bacterium]|nr:ribosome maturation factor RimP [Deltaproteobacteria bacterium]